MPPTFAKLIVHCVLRFTIRPPVEVKCTSSPAFARVLTARSGRFTSATWKVVRHRRVSLVRNPKCTSPRLGIRPPSAA
eukprot:15467625-Alexandrium_andersonii.AAC.1